MMVRNADIELAGSSLHVFCGSNEAGKSSISEAIRFALLGDTPRVNLKKDFGRLLSDGADKGSVELVFDGISVARDIQTGKSAVDVGANMSPAIIAALRLALGAQGFVDMKPDERRTMMFDLVGVSMGADEICARLVAKGLPESFVTKSLRPLLKASVTAAHTHGKGQLQQLRANWEATTQDKFGSEKCKTWKAPDPVKPGKLAAGITDLEAAKADIDKLDDQSTEISQKVGRMEGEVKQRRKYDEQLERLKTFVENKAQIGEDREKAAEEVRRLTDLIATEEEMIALAAKAAEKRYNCPSCDCTLKINIDDELEFASPKDGDFHDDKGAAARRQEIQRLQGMLTISQEALKVADGRLDAVKDSEIHRTRLAELIAPLATEQDLAAATEELRVARQKLMVDRETYQEAVKYKQAVDNAAATTKRAGEIFGAWLTWTRVTELLEPKGIPGEILNEAMEQVNRRLAASAELAGWGAPSITEDMEIIRLGRDDDVERPYSMLSESAKWRVGAVIAEVISTMAGVKLLVLDRWDVLDLPSRAQFMKWCSLLAQDSFDSIITMATLRGSAAEKPKVAGFEVHWVEGGVVS